MTSDRESGLTLINIHYSSATIDILAGKHPQRLLADILDQQATVVDEHICLQCVEQALAYPVLVPLSSLQEARFANPS